MIAERPSLTLVHQTHSRWRFRVEISNDLLDWNKFQQGLYTLFPDSSWLIRINQISKSLIIHCTESASSLQRHSSSLIQAKIIQVLARLGVSSIVTTPLTPVEVVLTNPSFDFHSNRGFMFGFANIASAFFSFSVLLVSLSLFTVGFIGMFVPFSPGVWLIMLGSIAFDLALFLRQPFIKVS